MILDQLLLQLTVSIHQQRAHQFRPQAGQPFVLDLKQMCVFGRVRHAKKGVAVHPPLLWRRVLRTEKVPLRLLRRPLIDANQRHSRVTKDDGGGLVERFFVGQFHGGQLPQGGKLPHSSALGVDAFDAGEAQVGGSGTGGECTAAGQHGGHVFGDSRHVFRVDGKGGGTGKVVVGVVGGGSSGEVVVVVGQDGGAAGSGGEGGEIVVAVLLEEWVVVVGVGGGGFRGGGLFFVVLVRGRGGGGADGEARGFFPCGFGGEGVDVVKVARVVVVLLVPFVLHGFGEGVAALQPLPIFLVLVWC